MSNKSTRGGKRIGAGRKPSGNTIGLSIRITPENKQWLDTQGNKTATINSLIEQARKNAPNC